MGRALDDLIDLLELEQLEVNLFRGVSPDEDRQRVFGGQVAGQALVAAGRTVDSDRRVHSLHAYFLRPGDPRIPIVYDVDRIRDGHSFTTRRVVAIQHGRAIFNLSASFHIDEPGPEHQYPMPDAPDPDDAADDARAARAVRRPVPGRVRRVDPARPPDRHALVAAAALARSRSEPARARAARVVPRRRQAARRSAAARVRRRVRVRPHAARHRGDVARAFVGRRPLHDREPRPRDVVPPAVPRRRVAAVPPEEPVGVRARAASPRASSSAATARSRSR